MVAMKLNRDAAQDEGCNPQGELAPLAQRVVFLQDGCRCGLYIRLLLSVLLVSGIHIPYPSFSCFSDNPCLLQKWYTPSYHRQGLKIN